MEKTIEFYTNLVAENWSPKSLDTGIGGSEEVLIILARELAKKGYDVTVYHNGEHGDFDGVHYKDHGEFKPFVKRDIFVSYKNRPILDQSIAADKIIYWTTEIEPKLFQYEIGRLDSIVHLSRYHELRNVGAQPEALKKSVIIGNPVDLKELSKYRNNKKKNFVLYCSSFDRGLEDLLKYWKPLAENLGTKKLKITYGWDFMDKVIASNPNLRQWQEDMELMMKQPGIELLGRVSKKKMNKLYAEAKYWTLPLNKPDAELFCLNAVKAQHLGAQPVIMRDGALKETVKHYIPYREALKGKTKVDLDPLEIDENMVHASQYSVEKIVKQWEKILN